MKGPEAAILDIDGTLLLSNDAHARAFVDAAEELGYPGVEFEAVRRLIGMGGDRLIPRVFGVEQESPEGERIDERKGEIFRERYLPSLRPAPGARALLERMRAEGLLLTVATSSGEDDVDLLLERAGVRDLVEEKTSAGDVEASKPSPDVVEAAMEKADAGPARAVMLGDTPYDVEAATRAGVPIVALRCGGWGDEDLAGAAALYDDPAHLLAEYDRSPFARTG